MVGKDLSIAVVFLAFNVKRLSTCVRNRIAIMVIEMITRKKVTMKT